MRPYSLATLALALTLAGCATFPVGQFDRTYGTTYDVRGSRDGIVELIRGVARRLRLRFKEDRDPAGNVSIKTEYVQKKNPENLRRELRLSYEVSVVSLGTPQELRQIITVSCRIESRGIHETTWRLEEEIRTSSQYCASDFRDEVDRVLQPIIRKGPPK